MSVELPVWVDRAACRGLNPDRFFPEPWDQEAIVKAKAVCRTCPVRSECLDYALHEPCFRNAGVLGGLTVQERTRLRKRMRKAAA